MVRVPMANGRLALSLRHPPKSSGRFRSTFHGPRRDPADVDSTLRAGDSPVGEVAQLLDEGQEEGAKWHAPSGLLARLRRGFEPVRYNILVDWA